MKKFFCIFLVFICFVGFSEDSDPPFPAFSGGSFSSAVSSSVNRVILGTYSMPSPIETTTSVTAVSSVPFDYGKFGVFRIYLDGIDCSGGGTLGDCRISGGNTNSTSKPADVFTFIPDPNGVYNLCVQNDYSSMYPPGCVVSVDANVSVVTCPNMSDCRQQKCGVCDLDVCVVHGTHFTRCFQCVHRNIHCHCSNSEALLDQWETVARQNPICSFCNSPICGLCTHSCFDAFCPNLDSCVPKTCSVCSSEYCGTHVLHFCSNYTQADLGPPGLISSQTSVHGGADVNVTIDTEGLSSAISDMGGKIDESNQNLQTIISGLGTFNQDFRQGNLFLTQRMDYMMNQLDGIGTGIGDLNTGVGDLNTGIGDLNTGVGTLNEGVDALNEELTDVGESLDDQTGLLQDIKDSLVGGSPIASGTIDGGDFDLPDVEDEYEYELDLTFFDRLREKLAFPSGYFSFSSSDDLSFEFPLEVFDHDFTFSIDFNDPVLNPLRSKVRAVSSFLMVFVFSMSIFKTISLW